jgi:transposase
MTSRIQRSYTPEKRTEALELSKKIGASAAARELGIPSDTLYTWISKEKNGYYFKSEAAKLTRNASKKVDLIIELEREIKRLRNENAQLKKEHQILEDAASFFASRRKR